jgi:hypothetical protein
MSDSKVSDTTSFLGSRRICSGALGGLEGRGLRSRLGWVAALTVVVASVACGDRRIVFCSEAQIGRDGGCPAADGGAAGTGGLGGGGGTGGQAVAGSSGSGGAAVGGSGGAPAGDGGTGGSGGSGGEPVLDASVPVDSGVPSDAGVLDAAVTP